LASGGRLSANTIEIRPRTPPQVIIVAVGGAKLNAINPIVFGNRNNFTLM